MVHLSTLQRHNGAVKEDENQRHKNNYALYSHTCQCGYKEHAHLLSCEGDKTRSEQADFLAASWGSNEKKVGSSREACTFISQPALFNKIFIRMGISAVCFARAADCLSSPPSILS